VTVLEESIGDTIQRFVEPELLGARDVLAVDGANRERCTQGIARDAGGADDDSSIDCGHGKWRGQQDRSAREAS
jgi:hypothetical protein